MGTTQSDNRSGVDGSSGPDKSVYSPSDGVADAIRESVLLKIAIGGVVFTLIGVFFDSGVLVPTGGLWSIWAAIFAVWGAGLFLFGIGAYGFLWWRRY
ncbi:hypothetical protein Harman_40840 [Haloarcula mannanilytica]|uniref:Uncharacterized protein n=1 Tax=Haloarcula mannanilytica TaxID=2509225 RepID=A0A4C2EVC1_9EURY|nr:hypothetical protein [Haloarcula mannanilytica]GCF16149.1 hypothetical protein Harman_40840 [Haloarcula mannanilytica]